MVVTASDRTGLGSGRIGPLLFKLALPAITAQVINALYNIVDRMYIGRLPEVGADALTGVGVTFPIITAVSAFAALVSMGGAPRASIALGMGDRDKAEEILGNCVSALLALSVLLTAAVQIFGRGMLLAFGASSVTIGYAWRYIYIYSMGTVFVQLALGLNAFINAQGFARTAMLSVLIGAVCNITLDPVLMFWLGMGVSGAALATVISQAVSAVWVVSFLRSEKSVIKIKKSCMRPRTEILLPVLALGASPFVMQSTESLISVCFNTSLLKYGGDASVGVMAVAGGIMQFSMFPLHGLTQGAQPIISFNYGAGKIERVESAFRVLLASCLVYSFILWCVSVFSPSLLVSVFTGDPVLAGGARFVRIYMCASLIFGAQVACQQTFVALGNSMTSLFLALLRKVFLLIPLIYILPNFFDDKVFAVFLAEPLADALAVCTTSALFAAYFTKLKREMLLHRALPEGGSAKKRSAV